MATSSQRANRVVIVGGGVAGLSIAVRLAQSGVPVTVLESSKLGHEASTRNQGWLYSGAWFAPQRVDLARLCYESYEHTLRFCPEALEPHCGPMVYLAQHTETDVDRWMNAWEQAGIPFSPLSAEELFKRFPHLAIAKAAEAFELPDRAIRMPMLLKRLAQVAEAAGAEIRTQAPVTRLLYNDGRVEGVEVSGHEPIYARLVILAGNALGGFLLPGYGADPVAGSQPTVTLVAQKSHLVAVKPAICQHPMCVMDLDGFNHVPHPPVSIFGSNRWKPVASAENEQADPEEIEYIWNQVRKLFPDVTRDNHQAVEWAGTTIQAMHVDQIEPGKAPLPTAVDHSREAPAAENLISVFPGRASLWPQLAEMARKLVLEKLESQESVIEAPPWGTLTQR
jgi:glycine/D-amino acid oxidase-like deaminating enzyme